MSYENLTENGLRAWQTEALKKYFDTEPQDFTVVATPGAGKTTFALQLARTLVLKGTINRMIVVAPTEYLKTQWAQAAAHFNLALDPYYKNSQGPHGAHYLGVVVTYAQVASKPALHRGKTENGKTLVILDEIHHAGDSLSWGDGIREAFGSALRRLCLTGTPFRSDTATIPFVRYENDHAGFTRSQADYSYSYAQALQDRVVRPVIFHAYSGYMQWRTQAGEEMESYLGESGTKDVMAFAWRTALDPAGNWISQVITAADKRLKEIRRAVPDAAGMLIASNIDHAKAYAKLIKNLTGELPVVVLSDDTTAGQRIEQFRTSKDQWLVAVKMVSEGADIQRLMVGIYATNTSTALFFAQAIGRYIRARKPGELASIFLPSAPPLVQLANEIEKERDHALRRHAPTDESLMDLEASLLEKACQEEQASDEQTKEKFQALSSQAAFEKVVFDGGEFGSYAWAGTEEEHDFLGIPGLLDSTQLGDLLRQRQAEQQKRKKSGTQVLSEHHHVKQLRSDLAKLVSAWSIRTGIAHGVVHLQLREYSGGPAVPQATQEQLQKRVDKIRGWFVGKT